MKTTFEELEFGDEINILILKSLIEFLDNKPLYGINKLKIIHIDDKKIILENGLEINITLAMQVHHRAIVNVGTETVPCYIQISIP